jgi:quercetin dioxygenase-like cupin family protein
MQPCAAPLTVATTPERSIRAACCHRQIGPPHHEVTDQIDGYALDLPVVHKLAGCDASVVDIVTLSDASGYDSDRVVAEPFLEGSQCNVRVIRLSSGQVLPAHTHGSSDLMLFAVEGEGTLDTGDGAVRFGAGSLAFYRSDEELRVANTGLIGLTLLAFLSPPFPPRSGT